MEKEKMTIYDTMSIDDLRELLRREADGAVELGIDELLYICEIVAECEKQVNPDKIDVNAAWERFLKYYAPEGFQSAQ